MANTDILLNDDFTPQIKDGDFVVGESDAQHVEANVLLHPGELRQYPALGFGADRFLKKKQTDATQFKSELKAALKLDGYRPQSIDVSKGFGDFKVNL